MKRLAKGFGIIALGALTAGAAYAQDAPEGQVQQTYDSQKGLFADGRVSRMIVPVENENQNDYCMEIFVDKRGILGENKAYLNQYNNTDGWPYLRKDPEFYCKNSMNDLRVDYICDLVNEEMTNCRNVPEDGSFKSIQDLMEFRLMKEAYEAQGGLKSEQPPTGSYRAVEARSVRDSKTDEVIRRIKYEQVMPGNEVQKYTKIEVFDLENDERRVYIDNNSDGTLDSVEVTGLDHAEIYWVRDAYPAAEPGQSTSQNVDLQQKFDELNQRVGCGRR